MKQGVKERKEKGGVKSWLVNHRSLPNAEFLANNYFSFVLVLFFMNQALGGDPPLPVLHFITWKVRFRRARFEAQNCCAKNRWSLNHAGTPPLTPH